MARPTPPRPDTLDGLRVIAEFVDAAAANRLVDAEVRDRLLAEVERRRSSLLAVPTPPVWGTPAAWALPAPALVPSAAPVASAAPRVRRAWRAVAADIAVHGLVDVGVALVLTATLGFTLFAFSSVEPLLRTLGLVGGPVALAGCSLALRGRGAPRVAAGLELAAGALTAVVALSAFADGAPFPPDLAGPARALAWAGMSALLAAAFAWLGRGRTGALHLLVAPLGWFAAGSLAATRLAWPSAALLAVGALAVGLTALAGVRGRGRWAPDAVLVAAPAAALTWSGTLLLASRDGWPPAAILTASLSAVAVLAAWHIRGRIGETAALGITAALTAATSAALVPAWGSWAPAAGALVGVVLLERAVSRSAGPELETALAAAACCALLLVGGEPAPAIAAWTAASLWAHARLWHPGPAGEGVGVALRQAVLVVAVAAPVGAAGVLALGTSLDLGPVAAAGAIIAAVCAAIARRARSGPGPSTAGSRPADLYLVWAPLLAGAAWLATGAAALLGQPAGPALVCALAAAVAVSVLPPAPALRVGLALAPVLSAVVAAAAVAGLSGNGTTVAVALAALLAIVAGAILATRLARPGTPGSVEPAGSTPGLDTSDTVEPAGSTPGAPEPVRSFPAASGPGAVILAGQLPALGTLLVATGGPARTTTLVLWAAGWVAALAAPSRRSVGWGAVHGLALVAAHLFVAVAVELWGVRVPRDLLAAAAAVGLATCAVSLRDRAAPWAARAAWAGAGTVALLAAAAEAGAGWRTCALLLLAVGVVAAALSAQASAARRGLLVTAAVTLLAALSSASGTDLLADVAPAVLAAATGGALAALAAVALPRPGTGGEARRDVAAAGLLLGLGVAALAGLDGFVELAGWGPPGGDSRAAELLRAGASGGSGVAVLGIGLAAAALAAGARAARLPRLPLRSAAVGAALEAGAVAANAASLAQGARLVLCLAAAILATLAAVRLATGTPTSEPARPWTVPLTLGATASTIAALWLAALQPGPMALVVALVVLAAQGAGAGLATDRAALLAVAPAAVAAAVLVAVAELPAPPLLALTLPVGAGLLVEADLAARAVRRGRLPASPEAIAALDSAALAVTLLPALGQVASGRLALTPVAVLAGAAVLVWGAAGRVRRRVLAGAAAAAAALVLVVAVPLVRLLPQVEGAWLWVSLAVLGGLLLLGAASLERGRSVVAGTWRRIEEGMRDWS